MTIPMLPRFLQARHFWLVALLATLLVGVQLVQASPLHEHSAHSVDCGLCHLPTVDGPQDQQAPRIPAAQLQVRPLPGSTPGFSSHCSVPYQGRAPPLLSR